MKGNAKIKSSFLGYEDHGILTCFLYLEQESSSQSFGGFRLDAPKDGNSYLGTFWIKRILETVGVSEWSDLTGKYVRVDGEDFGDIKGIGHIINNKLFYPRKEIDERLLEIQK